MLSLPPGLLLALQTLSAGSSPDPLLNGFQVTTITMAAIVHCPQVLKYRRSVL